MINKRIVLATLTLGAILLSGCDRDRGTARYAEDNYNVLGIAKVEKESYQPVGVATFDVSTDELYARKNYDGTKRTYLWGLITVRDY